ncbi:MAG: right-handed parallel beta-helix repeat-containing protein [bacterium]|nr:right-handed parallel beta-helix repeat-containing protein [bacterium]
MTFEGAASGGTLDGTFTVVGARRVAFKNLKITGSGSGVIGTDNASFTVEDCQIVKNAEDGVQVLGNSRAMLKGNALTDNGQGQLNQGEGGPGRGVSVMDSGSAEIIGNEITGNRSDGVGVHNDGYAKLINNAIESNGRPEVFEAGLAIARAKVRANGNRYKDNPYAAITVYNGGNYRTGNYLNSNDTPDNILPFESIKSGSEGLAVELGQMSFVDLRQVNVIGHILVARQSMLQMRGDNVGPNRECSTVDGNIYVHHLNALARLRDTNVTGGIYGPPSGVEGDGVCPPAPPPMP